MKIAIVGSRDYPDLGEVQQFVDSLISSDVIVSGGAKGVDKTAAFAARERGMQVIEYLPDWKTHGKQAGFLRNLEIVLQAEHLVAFHFRNSRGTQHSIKLAHAHHIPVQTRHAWLVAGIGIVDGLLTVVEMIVSAGMEPIPKIRVKSIGRFADTEERLHDVLQIARRQGLWDYCQLATATIHYSFQDDEPFTRREDAPFEDTESWVGRLITMAEAHKLHFLMRDHFVSSADHVAGAHALKLCLALQDTHTVMAS